MYIIHIYIHMLWTCICVYIYIYIYIFIHNCVVYSRCTVLLLWPSGSAGWPPPGGGAGGRWGATLNRKQTRAMLGMGMRFYDTYMYIYIYI